MFTGKLDMGLAADGDAGSCSTGPAAPVARSECSPDATVRRLCEEIVATTDCRGAALVDLQGTRGLFATAGLPDRTPSRAELTSLAVRARDGVWLRRSQVAAEQWPPVEGAVAYAPVGDAQAPAALMVLWLPEGCTDDRVPATVHLATWCATRLLPGLRSATQLRQRRARMASVIDAEAFDPVFQPIRRLADDRVVGFEALTRFDDGLAPAVVFEEATQIGMLLELERATMRRALAAAGDLPPTAWLSLNASPQAVLAGLEGLGCLGRAVTIELSETEPVTDYLAVIRAVRTAGRRVLVCVDDVGAGYASLHHVLALRPDILKLDLSLIRQIDRDPGRQALVAGMVQFSERVGCRLVAEGVESADVLTTLCQLGVGYGQGYWLGRPEPLPV